MDFENRLRMARIKRGITQQRTADMANTSLRNYQCYEQGVRRPKYETLVELCNILNVSADYLLGLTDEEE